VPEQRSRPPAGNAHTERSETGGNKFVVHVVPPTKLVK
jgi:hypothetical protein